MAQTLRRRGVEEKALVVINNFMLSDFGLSDKLTETIAKPQNESDAMALSQAPSQLASEATSQAIFESKAVNAPPVATLRIAFAGNLGRFQGLETLLEAFLALPEHILPMQLHFIGEGAASNQLQKMAGSADNVFFHGHYPFAEACQLMSTFDAGVVSIQPDIYRYAYPSKTLTYLGLGMPILAFVEPESALAQFIASHELGVSASNTDIASLQKGFEAIGQFLMSEANSRARIKAVYEVQSSEVSILQKWGDLFSQLSGKACESSQRGTPN